MTFLSYAQNFEDVMLWRALKDVEQGFYVDVGANDPETDSVTHAFYQRGWRGINIEPVSQWHKRLEQARPRDINLALAAGAQSGEITLHEMEDTGLSTTLEETAKRHEASGFTRIERSVPVETLTSICLRFHVAPIHFLKIDVEGSEEAVLRGIDFTLIRPWIIVIESTLPLTQTENCQEWENILDNSHYRFVYFDGLNRFYISPDHPELAQHFEAPPNVFDSFTFVGTASHSFCTFLNDRVAAAESSSAQQSARADHALEQLAESQQRLSQIEQRAGEQEQRVLQAEQRSGELESRATELESKALQAADRALEQEQRALQREAHISELERQLVQADQRAIELGLKADQAADQIVKCRKRLKSDNARIGALEHLLVQAEERAAHATQDAQRAAEMEQRAVAVEARLNDEAQHVQNARQIAHDWWLQAQAFEVERNALRASWSWRVTRPLRWSADLLGQRDRPVSAASSEGSIVDMAASAVRRPLAEAMRIVLRDPVLAGRINQRLLRYPALHRRLVSVAQRSAIVPSGGPLPPAANRAEVDYDPANLTPHAREIYNALASAIEHRRKLEA